MWCEPLFESERLIKSMASDRAPGMSRAAAEASLFERVAAGTPSLCAPLLARYRVRVFKFI
jgi:hypothetical protein